ncbi:MAG TPA: response regulator [Chroococcales cyanobacterium]
MQVSENPQKSFLRILLAEDNAVNQKMTKRILEKRGHTISIANNGVEAVDLWSKESYDLILMDVVMPEMNGVEATAKIREREKAGGGHIPIIAVTAHTMVRNRDRCRELSMDGFIAKPIQINNLLEEIERLIPSQAIIVPVSPPGENLARKLLAELDGDLELIRELVQSLLVDVPRHLSDLKERMEEGDSAGVEFTAQVIKGALGNFGADTVRNAIRSLEFTAKTLRGPIGEFASGSVWNAAYAVERIGKSRDLTAGKESLEVLENQLKKLTNALDDFA